MMEKKIKKIHIIINPASGKEDSILPVINETMHKAGIEWEAFITHKTGDATRYAKNAVNDGIDALAVYGGDGTLTEAINGLIGSAVPLAILPGGSANVMAKELGIPLDLEEACGLLSQFPVRLKAIDVGKFDERYFAVGISFGYGADLVKGADRLTKNKIGILSYVLAAVSAIRKTRKAVYHLNIDGQEYDIGGLTCLIANTGNLGFTTVSFDKHIDVSDGFLDIVVLRKANLNLVKLAVLTLLKRERPHNLELVKHWQGKNISISSRPKQTVQCDGEVIENHLLKINVLPGAISVMVPNNTSETSV